MARETTERELLFHGGIARRLRLCDAELLKRVIYEYGIGNDIIIGAKHRQDHRLGGNIHVQYFKAPRHTLQGNGCQPPTFVGLVVQDGL